MASRYPRTNDDDRRSRRSAGSSSNARSSRSAYTNNSHRSAASRPLRANAYSRDRYGSASRAADRRDLHSSGRSSQSVHAGSAAQYSRSSSHYSHKAARKMSRGKKVLIGALCAVLVAVVGVGTAFAVYVGNVNRALQGGLSDSDFSDLKDVLTPTTFNEPFYMLLIGSDERLEDASMGARTDTNIVARVDPPNNTVTLISIPRDTMIDLDGYGTVKFNAAYTYGGIEGVITESEQLMDISISHFAMVNFEELVQLVDVVGGVDVEVPERIDDPDAGNIVIEAGTQHLDGEAALVFARSRAYADGDFTRTSNQRLLIEALVNKVLSLPATELPGIIAAGAECVTTDLTINDIFGLATQFQDAGNITIYSCMVPSTTAEVPDMYGNLVSYVVCDEEGLADIMEVVKQGGDPSTVQTYGATESSLYANESSIDAGTGGNGSSGGGGSYNPANEYGSY